MAVVLVISLQAQSPLVNNMPASGVLGQSSFTAGSSGLSASGLNAPSGVAVDPTTGKLFIADRYNNRVLRWSSSAKLTNGSPAEAVFGQTDFVTGSSGASASRFNDPLRVHVDAVGTLWVSDYLNNRVLRFNNASMKPSGAAADGVLGQPDFTTTSAATTASKMRGPVGVFVDAKGTLWVADRLNHRVLRYNTVNGKANGAAADGVLGQPDFTTGTSGVSAVKMNRPMGLYADAEDHLWVTEDDNNRVIRFDSASARPNGAPANGVL
ncbi:MAG: hypothetical protein HUU02_11485, partial [Bacteroidetes bacterium]|nr:hypothetical protein [Bacteroidota bacterium]